MGGLFGSSGMPPAPPQTEDPDAALLGVMKTNGYNAMPPPGQSLPAPKAQASPTVGLSAFPAPPSTQNLDPDTALLQVMHGNGGSSTGTGSVSGMPTLNDFVKQKTGRVDASPSSLLQTGDSL